MLDEAAKKAGITQKQYREWRKIECMDTSTMDSRGRSLSRRKKGMM